MKTLIEETSKLIGTSHIEEVNRNLRKIMELDFPQVKCIEPKALKAADELLRIYVGAVYTEKVIGKVKINPEDIFRVASKLLVVAYKGFDSPEKNNY